MRSTRRRQDAADLPRVPVEDRTVGRVFTAPDGQEYRPSMFLTLTLPSYGPVRRRGPGRPGPLRLPAGRAGCAALPEAGRPVLAEPAPLRRLQGPVLRRRRTPTPPRPAPARRRSAAPSPAPPSARSSSATYLQVWWPPFDQPVYVHRHPGVGRHRLRRPRHRRRPADLGRGARPARRRPGRPAGARDAVRHPDRHARHHRPLRRRRPGRPLPHQVPDQSPSPTPTPTTTPTSPAYLAHVDRLHAELRWLPCSPTLRELAPLRHPTRPTPAPACAPAAAPRKPTTANTSASAAAASWSPGSGPARPSREHRADRATVVREALLTAGIVAPEIERLAADVTLPDGRPRFVWTDTQPDPQHLRPGHPRRHRRTATLARPVRSREGRDRLWTAVRQPTSRP